MTAHNFLHKKDNFRMYYFDFSLFSHNDWRISHALSHHVYPNTVLDVEMSMQEPFMNYRPVKKGFMQKRGVIVYMNILQFFAPFIEFTKRTVMIFKGK